MLELTRAITYARCFAAEGQVAVLREACRPRGIEFTFLADESEADSVWGD